MTTAGNRLARLEARLAPPAPPGPSTFDAARLTAPERDELARAVKLVHAAHGRALPPGW